MCWPRGCNKGDYILNNWDYHLDPAQMEGLDHEDFGRVLNHVVVDQLNVLQAVEQICRQVGFSFREV